jgi:hypothetical protein
LTLPAAILLFPVAYICGDVLTEVYGYAAARRAICWSVWLQLRSGHGDCPRRMVAGEPVLDSRGLPLTGAGATGL